MDCVVGNLAQCLDLLTYSIDSWRCPSLTGAPFNWTGAHHRECYDNQGEDGAGKPCQYLNLSGSKSKATVSRVTPSRRVGEGAQIYCDGARTHVETVSQQGHRVVLSASRNLDHHHSGRHSHHGSRAAPARDVALVELVCAAPGGQAASHPGATCQSPGGSKQILRSTRAPAARDIASGWRYSSG